MPCLCYYFISLLCARQWSKLSSSCCIRVFHSNGTVDFSTWLHALPLYDCINSRYQAASQSSASISLFNNMDERKEGKREGRRTVSHLIPAFCYSKLSSWCCLLVNCTAGLFLHLFPQFRVPLLAFLVIRAHCVPLGCLELKFTM